MHPDKRESPQQATLPNNKPSDLLADCYMYLLHQRRERLAVMEKDATAVDSSPAPPSAEPRLETASATMLSPS